jgi:hypothetical protein
MSLIDSTYFINDINLPTGKYDDTALFITKFEKKFLVRVFGYTLYKLIAAYDSAHPENTVQRIRDIIEGKEFEESPFTYRWNGLINTDLISPIAYYVYYYYQKQKQTHTGTSGETKKDIIDISDTNIKLVKAWQNMVDLVGSRNEYNVDSIYYFMMKNQATYPEWQFEPFENINSFGI